MFIAEFILSLHLKIEVKMNETKTHIMSYAARHHSVSAPCLVSEYGMKAVTARQYLSDLSTSGNLVRIGRGEYALSGKQQFQYEPTDEVRAIYNELKTELPFTDFCVYEGSIFSPLQHHLSINHAIYVETNRDAVESVFERLKEKYKDVFRQPNSSFMYDYVDLKEQCIIVKPLVTEAPLIERNGVKVPTLEKILVDMLKDDDFDYLRGNEEYYMYQMALDLYTINLPKLLRYARRRGISDTVSKLIKQ